MTTYPAESLSLFSDVDMDRMYHHVCNQVDVDCILKHVMYLDDIGIYLAYVALLKDESGMLQKGTGGLRNE